MVSFYDKRFGPLTLSVDYRYRPVPGPPYITREQLIKLLDIIADHVLADGPVSIWEATLDDGTKKSDFNLRWVKTECYGVGTHLGYRLISLIGPSAPRCSHI